MSEGGNTKPGSSNAGAALVDAVKVPVIAAGGIADSRGIVAAFACWVRRLCRLVRHIYSIRKPACLRYIWKRWQTPPMTTR